MTNISTSSNTYQKITPFLWYDNNAHEAIDFYTSIFPDSKIIQKTPLVSTFELAGQKFMAMNGGPLFHFNESISMFITCEDQAEIDMYWDTLTSDGGSPGQCGWLRDKYGLSWQVVPRQLTELMSNDPGKAGRVMNELMKMSKIDIETLINA